jgi:hypothetical protein
MTLQHLQLLNNYYNNLLIQINLFYFLIVKESGIEFSYSNTSFSILSFCKDPEHANIVTLSFQIGWNIVKANFS